MGKFSKDNAAQMAKRSHAKRGTAARFRNKLEAAARWVVTHDEADEPPTPLHKHLRADRALLYKALPLKDGGDDAADSDDGVGDYLATVDAMLAEINGRQENTLKPDP